MTAGTVAPPAPGAVAEAARRSPMSLKVLPAKVRDALQRAGVRLAGAVVGLGAGTRWLSAWLASLPGVERVTAIDFSRRRLVELAPVAIAHLGVPPEKIERRLADFNAPGLQDGIADFVFTDAAFHHASDRVAVGRVAHALLRPPLSWLHGIAFSEYLYAGVRS